MNERITDSHECINYVIDYALYECVQCNHDGKHREPKRMCNTIYWTLTMDHKDGATMTTGLAETLQEIFVRALTYINYVLVYSYVKD